MLGRASHCTSDLQVDTLRAKNASLRTHRIIASDLRSFCSMPPLSHFALRTVTARTLSAPIYFLRPPTHPTQSKKAHPPGFASPRARLGHWHLVFKIAQFFIEGKFIYKIKKRKEKEKEKKRKKESATECATKIRYMTPAYRRRILATRTGVSWR